MLLVFVEKYKTSKIQALFPGLPYFKHFIQALLFFKSFWHNCPALHMKRYLLSTTGLIFLLFWPIQAQEIITHNEAGEREHSSIPIRLNTTSETGYLKQLTRRGFRLETQGLLIESLDSSNVYAELNSNTGFNPASVIKIATSFAALSKFGPEYRL